jgi:hypothetical protein
LNRSSEEQTVPVSVRDGETLFSTTGDTGSILITGEGNARLLTLPPLTGVVLK